MFQKMKQQACEATGVEFIILDSIKKLVMLIMMKYITQEVI